MKPTAEVLVRPGSQGEHELQERCGTAARADRFYQQQLVDRLNDRMRAFVGQQEMMFVATADGRGECDNTFRAGPAGFVQVLDDKHLAWPEYRGNGVLASLGNISENAHVGLLFMDFVREVIGLHVNGDARIVEDGDFRARYPDLPVDDVRGRQPERWVLVEVHEAYIHCAKHIPRLQQVPADRAWGTDDVRRKGGDFFGVAADRRDPSGGPAPTASPAAEPRSGPDPGAGYRRKRLFASAGRAFSAASRALIIVGRMNHRKT